MTLALLISVAVVVSLWRTSHGKQHASPAPDPGTTVPGGPRPSRGERELTSLRDRYVAEDITLEDFERQIADALEHRPETPVERVEVHVWDAPPGHSLHIHLT